MTEGCCKTVYAAIGVAVLMKLMSVCFSCESHSSAMVITSVSSKFKIHGAQILLQGMEDADLQDARFLHYHRERIPL